MADRTCRTYNPRVRVGNWNEDIQLFEDTQKDFLAKKERGELLIQKSSNLNSSVLKKVQLSSSNNGLLHFGDKVMLYNRGAVDQTKYSSTDEPRVDSVLSACVSPSAVQTSASVPSGSGVSGCRVTKPSARNVFTIMSIDGPASHGKELCFGCPFYLCLGDENPLFLKSDVASFNTASKNARHCEVSLVDKPSFLTQFKVLPFDPRVRMEYEHTPVPANVKVVVAHVKTNQALAVEQAYLEKTIFGLEYEMSCHTYLDSHKVEMDVNHFVFVENVPGDDTAQKLSEQ